MKILIRKDTCAPVFITALFTIAKIWKQPKCPPTDEQIERMWYICTMECHYSAIQRMKCCHLKQHGWTLRALYQVQKSDRERQILYGITYRCNLKNTKTNEHNLKKKSRLTDIENKLVAISGREPT